MGPHQFTLNIGDADLTTARFEIDRRSRRQLYLEIHVADVFAPIVSDDIDDESGLSLPRIKSSFPRVHLGGNADLILGPRLDGDGAGNIPQFQTNVFAGGIIPRQALLGLSKDTSTGRSEDDRKQ